MQEKGKREEESSSSRSESLTGFSDRNRSEDADGKDASKDGVDVERRGEREREDAGMSADQLEQGNRSVESRVSVSVA